MNLLSRVVNLTTMIWISSFWKKVLKSLEKNPWRFGGFEEKRFKNVTRNQWDLSICKRFKETSKRSNSKNSSNSIKVLFKFITSLKKALYSNSPIILKPFLKVLSSALSLWEL